MKRRPTDSLIVVLTLVVSFLSLTFLSLPWYRAVLEGRSFTSTIGGISALPLIISVPFAWPHLIAGYLFRRRHDASRALLWAVGTGLLGAALYALVVRADFTPAAPRASYVQFYLRFASAPLLATLGFVLAHIARTRNVRTA